MSTQLFNYSFERICYSVGKPGNGINDFDTSSHRYGLPSVGNGIGGTNDTALSSHTHDAGCWALSAAVRASAICSAVGSVWSSGIGIFNI
jgi:hypothetical protein